MGGNSISKEEIQKAREMDLLTYLRHYEPDNLVPVSGRTYCTKEHDSLKISNGKWYWFSHSIGGVSALDYLIKVRGCCFVTAVEMVLGKENAYHPKHCKQEENKGSSLMLPRKNKDTDQVEAYLLSRGISLEVIRYCIAHGLLYESADMHSAVFLGYDLKGNVRYAAIRSTDTPYKGDAGGSDKHYSFCIPAEQQTQTVHVFEAAIDAMSYASLCVLKGQNWHTVSLLSLAGVYLTKRENVVPVALQRYLTDHPDIVNIYLHLDNDKIGRGAAKGIVSGLSAMGKYAVYDKPPCCGKDVNEYLQKVIK